MFGRTSPKKHKNRLTKQDTLEKTMTDNNKEFERFKEQFDEIIMVVGTRLDVLEQKIKEIGKMIEQSENSLRKLNQKSFLDWNGLQGTIGDMQKKISEIARPIRPARRDQGGYPK
jgi:chromosome segregation ATPase